jgi:hypothetical protein
LDKTIAAEIFKIAIKFNVPHLKKTVSSFVDEHKDVIQELEKSFTGEELGEVLRFMKP